MPESQGGQDGNSVIRFLRWMHLLPAQHDHLRSVGRLVLLAALVGIVAGLGAVAFQVLSHLGVKYGLQWVAGYRPQGPTGEADFLAPAVPLFGAFRPWLILIVITVGGLISGIIVYSLAPEAEGHGTDAAIKAYHHGRGLIRPIVPLVKIVCSALTISSGGSGGREGPIAQIGAGFGSFLAVKLKLSESERRTLLAAGMGAGIAAIFKAPLAGAIFAIEVLYRDEDFEAEALIPSFISCTVAYCVYGLIALHGFGAHTGFQPLFTVMPGLKFDNPMILVPLTILALGMVMASYAYVRCFYGTVGLFQRLPLPHHLRPALGALATGVLGLIIFYALTHFGTEVQMDSLNVLSFGYGVIQKILLDPNHYGMTTAIILLLAVGLGKILTTSLTIGSGGSGGVFGPSMVIGGALGGVIGLLLKLWMPTVVTRIDVFVILGMASFFSAAAKTPVSTIIMVSELTGGYELLIPAMWVSALAYLVSRGWSIYREQVSSRLYSPAHRGDFVIGVLGGVTVREIWKPNDSQVVTLAPETPLQKLMDLIPGTTQTVFPVLDSQGQYRGLLGISDVRRYLYDRPMGNLVVAQDAMATNIEPLRIDTDLAMAMIEFAETSYDELPVIGSGLSGQFVGLMRRQEIVAAYNRRLAQARAGGILGRDGANARRDNGAM